MTGQWVTFAVRSGREFEVERQLRDCGYRVLLPLVRRFIRPHRGKAQPRMVPMFEGYLFAEDWQGWPEQSIAGVWNILRGSQREPLLIGDSDIIVLHSACAEFDEPWPRRGRPIRSDLAIGDDVGFDLAGEQILAKLTNLSPNGRAVVERMILGRQVPFEVDQQDLVRA